MWSNVSPTFGSRSIALEPNESSTGVKQFKKDNTCLNQVSISNNNCSNNNNAAGGSPLMRYKHAVCSSASGHIYIHGGRFGNLPLDDDVWRFDPHQNSWLQLETRGARPPSLQEHTLVEHGNQLYLFGGQVSASNTENSFWRLDLATNEWSLMGLKSNKFGAHLGPTNRRGHSAIVFGDSMYIYGGFEDFRGSSNQLWEFDLIGHRWQLRNLSSSSAIHPEPRHSHSAIVYEHSMYIYGGLSNLKPLSDLWRWCWREKRWFKERSRGQSPGQLHGHTAIQSFGSMFVFGGERNGRTTRSLWRLNLANLSWQKIRPKGPRPNPTTWHGAIANPLSILDETNYIIEGSDADQLLTSEHLTLNTNGQHYLKSGMNQGMSNVPESSQNNNHRLVSYEAKSNNNSRRPIRLKSQQAQSSSSKTPQMVPQMARIAQSQQQRLASQGETRELKQKSRLSFLRRCRPSRPRSTYELKQVFETNAKSMGDTKATLNPFLRHSISTVPMLSTTTAMHQNQAREGEERGDIKSTENCKILDNLDTDIKEMFERAMSPRRQVPLTNGDERQAIKDEQSSQRCERNNDEEQTMSVDTITLVEATSGRSHYKTLSGSRANDSATLADLSMSRSQRTSYAYTTPPSEFCSESNEVRVGDIGADEQRPEERFKSRAFLAAQPHSASGYNRHDNRPKSEIVQSLIERADARIKHLYTPYFNYQSERQQRRQAAAISTSSNSRHNLDKSKRHTIHQTMTYYNLYFSEDKSSPSSGESNGLPPSSGAEDRRSSGGSESLVGFTRDNLSSTTIKGLASGATTTSSLGTATTTMSSGARLVGVHGSVADYENELSALELFGASGRSVEVTKNLAPERAANEGSADGGSSQSAPLSSSMQNALTARRGETTADSCADNTSLSFSVIAEFEEDDMLQYSSPTDPILVSEYTQRIANDSGRLHYSGSSPQGRDELPMDVVVADAKESLVSRSDESNNIGQNMNETSGHRLASGAHPDEMDVKPRVPHNSTSSGYDSTSGGFEQAHEHDLEAGAQGQMLSPGSGRRQSVQLRPVNASATSASDTQEDSSARTGDESSLGGFTETTTTTTTTSPEQSVAARTAKKMKAKLANCRTDNHGITKLPGPTTASTTADSLAFTTTSTCNESDCFGSLTDSTSASASKFSPGAHAMAVQTTSVNLAPNSTQRKVPNMVRPPGRFFGKQKSKTRYWQLCMFVIGGKQGGAHGTNEPITIWRLYI